MKGLFEMVFFLSLFTMLLGISVKSIVSKNPESVSANIKSSLSSTSTTTLEANTPPLLISPLSTTTLSRISADSVLLTYHSSDTETILLSKNENKQYLIASISKLMTALLADKLLPKTATTSVTKSIIAKRGATKKYAQNTSYDIETLIKSLLIESNNDAAWMLAEKVGSSTQFIKLMNQEAGKIGLGNTIFNNPTGVDPDSDSGNLSTSNDIVRLATYIYKNNSPVSEITILFQTEVSNVTGSVSYIASSTNILLKENLPFKIKLQKTGDTPKALKNLIVIFTKDGIDGYFSAVVLKSKDNFADTRIILSELDKSLASQLIN